MLRVFCSCLFLLFVSSICYAQIRLDKLELRSKEKYKIISSDILVVDTLVMGDSSAIILNPSTKENFIHAKSLIVGKGCSIIGHGKNGKNGKTGENGTTQPAPCRDGADGKDALPGEHGNDGLNFSLYLSDLKVNGSLIINVNGGDGGNGGRGGRGGDGGSGTRVCPAGNGGNGGNGAMGGDGGHGGAVSINCKACNDLHLLLNEKIVVKNYGGFGGVGGDGGNGGQAGLGPVKDGRNGQRGKEGVHANQGKTGLLNLSRE